MVVNPFRDRSSLLLTQRVLCRVCYLPISAVSIRQRESGTNAKLSEITPNKPIKEFQANNRNSVLFSLMEPNIEDSLHNPIPTVRFQPSAGPSQPIQSVSYQVTQQNGTPLLLTVPTPNSSSISGVGHTDMSSVSDDPSSSRGRGSSTDDTCGDDSPPAITLRIQTDSRKKK
ncbi:unnamed protein product [Larinioides sclopetarius]|uniref:Uncharacterized protein n=1 Tax=Larinioides sclopetarius TaxID=280406 RepID=A0AAV1ZXP9_9ARAC